MLDTTQIEKAMTLFYLNEEKIKELSTIEDGLYIAVMYNGFSNYGPYESELEENCLCFIDGDGQLFVNDGVLSNGNRLICYVAGNASDREFRINKEQLYTCAMIISIFSKYCANMKCNFSYGFFGELDNDFNHQKFTNYMNNITSLIEEI